MSFDGELIKVATLDDHSGPKVDIRITWRRMKGLFSAVLVTRSDRLAGRNEQEEISNLVSKNAIA